MAHRKWSRRAEGTNASKRKPYGLRVAGSGEIIEFEWMRSIRKHINLPGRRLYALCGIDQYTRRAVVHVSAGCSSRSARAAPMKIRERFGGGIVIVNDNGSENKREAEECPGYHNEPMDAAEMREVIDGWLFKYENQRPHDELGFLIPGEFESRFYSSKHSAMS